LGEVSSNPLLDGILEGLSTKYNRILKATFTGSNPVLTTIY